MAVYSWIQNVGGGCKVCREMSELFAYHSGIPRQIGLSHFAHVYPPRFLLFLSFAQQTLPSFALLCVSSLFLSGGVASDCATLHFLPLLLFGLTRCTREHYYYYSPSWHCTRASSSPILIPHPPSPHTVMDALELLLAEFFGHGTSTDRKRIIGKKSTHTQTHSSFDQLLHRVTQLSLCL